MLSQLSIKEGNQRIDIGRKKMEDLDSDDTNSHNFNKLKMQSPVILELNEEPHQVHNIKSNVHYASGHKFGNSANKVLLVKNVRRNGDFNEGIKEATSSGSGISQHKYNIESKQKIYRKEGSSKPKDLVREMNNNKFEYYPEEELKTKLDFDISQSKQEETKTAVMMKIKPLSNLELLKKSTPEVTSS